MNARARLLGSSLGRKYLMAGSGVVLVLFVIGHLVGNLQFFLPPHAINRYGHFLQSNLEILWPVRLILLALVTLHLGMAFHLWKENRAARPVAYASPVTAYGSSLASRTMLMSGLIIASFIVFHLLHFTVRLESVNGTPIPFLELKEPGTGYHDVFAMMVAGFQVWPVSLFYVVAIGLLCFHLSHGIGAMFQSLGFRNPACATLIARAAKVVAVCVFVGYLSIPTSVLLGRGRDYLESVKAHRATPAAPTTAGKEAGK
jgi:succinate dehydrogenase / fumarate reductase, cytochrome b subunit